MEKMEKRQAAEAGLDKYFTGRPCKNGHITYRYTATGACPACIVEANKRCRAKVRERIAEGKRRRLESEGA